MSRVLGDMQVKEGMKSLTLFNNCFENGSCREHLIVAKHLLSQALKNGVSSDIANEVLMLLLATKVILVKVDFLKSTLAETKPK